MIAAKQNKCLLAHDFVLQSREKLLNADLMTQRLTNILGEKFDSCEVGRVKYRPHTSLRVFYRLASGSNSLLLTARAFTNNRGREVFEDSADRTAVFYDQDLKTVFWKFPADRKIKQLRIFKNIPQDLATIGKNLWQKSELIGYAPEKCATVKCLNEYNETFAYAKCFADDEGKRIFSIYQKLQFRSADKLFIPNVLGYSAKHKTLFIEAVNGMRIADLGAENLPNSFRLFGEAIARFHEIKPLKDMPEFSRLKPEKFSTTRENIEKLRPENAEQALRLAQKLTESFEFADEPTVSLHGDVHAKNAIMRENGTLALIDLDQMSLGNASADVGSFLAGLFYKECVGHISSQDRQEFSEKFLEGYARTRQLPNEKSLNWHTAAALFTERIKRAINRFRVEGLEKFGSILSASERLLDGDLV